MARNVLTWSVAAGLAIVVLVPHSARAQDPSMVGQWSQVYSWSDLSAHMAVTSDGDVISWRGAQNKDLPTQIDVTDISVDGPPGPVEAMPTAATNLFSSAQTFLKDGRLVVIGGSDGTFYGGTNFANLFQDKNNTWAAGNSMSFNRFLPSTLELSSGDILALGGTDFVNNVKTSTLIPEVSNTGGGGWHQLTDAPMPNTNAHIDQASRIHLAPNGQVFFSSPGFDSYYLNTNGLGSWTFVAESAQVGVGIIGRTFGTSVMYGPGQVMIAGGGEIPTDSVQIIDLTQPTPAWQTIAPMNFARTGQNSTLLPDGTVLVTGGNSLENNQLSGAVLAAEIWNPTTQSWTLLASMNHIRDKDWTAVLLPDARVLVAGGVDANGSFQDAEIYSPPYLFNGAQPTITSAPASASLNQQFTVTTPDAANITNVTLLGLGSVYSEFNTSQRINQLAFSVGSGSLTVTAPSSHDLSPAGFYMLFLVNGSGVPSVASIMRIL